MKKNIYICTRVIEYNMCSNYKDTSRYISTCYVKNDVWRFYADKKAL